MLGRQTAQGLGAGEQIVAKRQGFRVDPAYPFLCGASIASGAAIETGLAQERLVQPAVDGDNLAGGLA
jgi:hypothetical protein